MNPRAVITGATKGIGLAIAEKFASEGFDLAVCSRTPADLNQMQLDFSSKYPTTQLLSAPTDLSKKAQVLDFAGQIISEWNRIDVLVNNAGLFIPGSVYLEEDGNLEKMMDTNLYGAYHLTRALLPVMLSQNSGHVFNMCSIASILAYPNGGAYSISKFAMYGFTKCLREELKDKGIKVSAILPGATWSDSWAGAELPQERLMQPDDVASTVWNAWQMGPSAVVEEIIIRPQLGDL